MLRKSDLYLAMGDGAPLERRNLRVCWTKIDANMHRKGRMGKTLRALGLMSGTSMDGIDVALIDTDGEETLARGPSGTYPYSEAFRSKLRGALSEAVSLQRR